jgi:hypothetical protein
VSKKELFSWEYDAAARSGRHLIDSLTPVLFTPSALRKAPFFFLLKMTSIEPSTSFPISVVSFKCAVSVLTAPVTHQALDLQKNEGPSSAIPVRFCGPRKSSVPGRVQWVLSTGFMVVSQPLVAYGVGGQDIDDLRAIGLERLTNQALWLFTNPTLGSPSQP